MPRTYMPSSQVEIRALARSHTRTAIRILAGILRNKKASAAARVAAATALLDRGWGKVPQPTAGGEPTPPLRAIRFERVFIEPNHTVR